MSYESWEQAFKSQANLSAKLDIDGGEKMNWQTESEALIIIS